MPQEQNVDNDINFIGEIQKGNHQAFAVLVKKYSKNFYSIAYRYVNDQKEAEDIVQTAFLKFWEYPYKFDINKKTSFKAWFSRIVINLAIDFLRKNKKEPLIDNEVLSNKDSAFTILNEKREMMKLEQCIRLLPIRQQTALNLGVYEEISYAEIATIMKTSLKSVQSLIMRAKYNLKKMMEDEYV